MEQTHFFLFFQMYDLCKEKNIFFMVLQLSMAWFIWHCTQNYVEIASTTYLFIYLFVNYPYVIYVALQSPSLPPSQNMKKK